MSETYQLELRIHRYDPDDNRSWIQTYHLEAGRILRFTDLLRKINQDQDPSLAWNSSCEHAQCGSCSMIINGRPLLACELLVENAVALFKTATFTIKPLGIAPLVRDLVAARLAATGEQMQQSASLVESTKTCDQGSWFFSSQLRNRPSSLAGSPAGGRTGRTASRQRPGK